MNADRWQNKDYTLLSHNDLARAEGDHIPTGKHLNLTRAKERIDSCGKTVVDELKARAKGTALTTYNTAILQASAIKDRQQSIGDNPCSDPKNLPGCAYFNVTVTFNTDPLIKKKIMLEYNGNRDFLAEFIYTQYHDKLVGILSKNRILNINERDFISRNFKKLSGQKRDNITKFIAANFKEELQQFGVTDQQITLAKKGGRRKQFILDTAKNHADELRAVGMNDEQIKEMQEKGLVPSGYNVHHKFNRFHAALMNVNYNSDENLILIKCSDYEAYHQQMHVYIDEQTNQIDDKNGSYAKINLVWPVGSVYDPYAKLSSEEIIGLAEKEIRKVLTPETKEQKQELDKSLATLTTSGQELKIVPEKGQTIYDTQDMRKTAKDHYPSLVLKKAKAEFPMQLRASHKKAGYDK